MTDHEHEWDLWEIFDGEYHCKIEGCRAKLTRHQAEAMLNEHAKLKRENDWKVIGDALPKDPEWVLVYADGAIACRAYVDEQFQDWEGCSAPGVVLSDITHWKELHPPALADTKESEG